MRDMLLVIAVAMIVPLGITRPFVSVAFWAYVSLLNPTFFVYGFASGIPFVKIAAAVTVISVIACREQKFIPQDRTSILVIAFLAIAVISQFTSLTDAAVGWEIVDKLWKIVVLYLLAVCFIRSRVRIHLLVLTVCIGVCFNGVGEALKYLLSAGGHKVEGTPNWGDNNQVALIVLMVMPLAQYVREVSQNRFVRMGLLGAIIFLAICVIATASRGGLAGLVVLALAAVSTSKHKIRYLTALLIAAVVLVKTAPDSWTERMDTIQEADQDSSFMGRVVVWKLSTLIALDHPFFGGGLHAVQSQNVWDAYVPSFNKLSFIPTEPPDIRPHAAHSIYFEILGDLGFLGLGVFLAIIASCIVESRRIKALARSRADLAWASQLVDALRLSLLTFLVTGAALSAAYHDLVFLLFAMFSTLRAAVSAAPSSASALTGNLPTGGWRQRRPASRVVPVPSEQKRVGLSPSSPHGIVLSNMRAKSVSDPNF